MALSSINFQKGGFNSYQHNFRTAEKEPTYLLPKEDRLENEYWQGSKLAYALFQEELNSTKRKGGRIPKFENSCWEGVMNLNKNHTMKDVKKVAKHIEEKFNITCTGLAIHRDEGYTEKNGKVNYNLHAHLMFMTYKDGKQNWRGQYIKPKVLSELQTEVAQILNMDRGKLGSEAIRTTHQQYKAIKRQEEAKEEKFNKQISKAIDETNQIKREFETFRKEMIQAKGYNKEDYKILSEAKKEALSKSVDFKEAIKILEKVKHNLIQVQEKDLTNKIIEASKIKTLTGKKIDENLLKDNMNIVFNGISELSHDSENLLDRMMRGFKSIYSKAKRIINKQKDKIHTLTKKVKSLEKELRELRKDKDNFTKELEDEILGVKNKQEKKQDESVTSSYRVR